MWLVALFSKVLMKNIISSMADEEDDHIQDITVEN